jgi:outer membrane lipoprotein-sorting protein
VKRFAAYQYGFLIGTLLLSSCSSKPQAPTNSQSNDLIVSSTPPFQTKEPQHYQAVRTITFSDSSGSAITQKTTIARSEIFRREERENNDSAVVFLESDKGRFVLLPEQKIYSEITDASPIDPTEFESSPERLLHPDAVSTSYQKLGSETVSGRNTTKYRVAVNTATGSNVTPSDTLIWIDESLGMPVKSETTAGDGSHVTMELSNIVLEVDKNLFQIPEDYVKLNATALRQRLHQKQVH